MKNPFHQYPQCIFGRSWSRCLIQVTQVNSIDNTGKPSLVSCHRTYICECGCVRASVYISSVIFFLGGAEAARSLAHLDYLGF